MYRLVAIAVLASLCACNSEIYVRDGVTDGVREVMRDTGVPVAFGVLTCDDVDQALARAGGDHGNKGVDVAQAAIEMARLLPALSKPPGDPA